MEGVTPSAGLSSKQSERVVSVIDLKRSSPPPRRSTRNGSGWFRSVTQSLHYDPSSLHSSTGPTWLPLINPSGPLYRMWSLLTDAVYGWIMLVTAAEVCFWPIDEPFVLSNLVVGLFLVSNVALRFFTMYPRGYLTSARRIRLWERSHAKIASHYASTWLVPDLLAAAGLIVDMLPLMVQWDVPSVLPGDEITGGRRDVRLLRVLWIVIRLARPLQERALKPDNGVDGALLILQQRFGVRFSTLTILRCMVYYLTAAHLFACAFALQARFADPSHAGGWLRTLNYCRPCNAVLSQARAGALDAAWTDELVSRCEPTSASLAAAAAATTAAAAPVPAMSAGERRFALEGGVLCLPPEQLYVAAVFYMLGLITGTTGGSLGQGEFTCAEQVLFGALLVVGALLWSLVIGTFCNEVANLSPEETAYKMTVDGLERFASRQGFQKELKSTIREFFIMARRQLVTEESKSLLVHMSPQLRSHVALHLNGWLKHVPFLRHVEYAFLVQVATR